MVSGPSVVATCGLVGCSHGLIPLCTHTVHTHTYATQWAGFFEVYSYISRVGSILFILLQLLIVVDFAFDLHEFLVGRANDYDEKLEADGYEANVCGNCWRVGYGILAIGCIVLGVGGIITMVTVPSFVTNHTVQPADLTCRVPSVSLSLALHSSQLSLCVP